MDRRKYLKSMALGSLAAGTLLQACNNTTKPPMKAVYTPTIDRTPAELKHEDELAEEKFFDDHEMATITLLANIIIPADDKSGSASDAGVPDFIEFIAKDMPHHQTPLRGGIKWLDLQCLNRYGKVFTDASHDQQMEMVDRIAYPEKAEPAMHQGVHFFNLMRDLTATGFFTSKIGIADLGYMGNKPNQWDGVPPDVLSQYGVAYDQKTLDECVKFDKTT